MNANYELQITENVEQIRTRDYFIRMTTTD